MIYKFAIPSYKRVDKLQSQTLKVLKDYNIPDKEIYIFLADKEEYKIYTKNIVGDYNFVLGVPTIHNQRNFITEYFDEGEKIVFMDDDIKEITKLTLDKKIEKHDSIEDIIKIGFSKCIEENCFIWGVYPVDNYFFMSNRITKDLKYIVGCFYGVINRHDKDLMVHLEDKEDYLRTLLYFKKDGGTIRLNNVGIKTIYFGEGGMNVNKKERLLEGEKNCKIIQQLFPNNVSIQVKKGKGRHLYYNLRLSGNMNHKKKKPLYYFIGDLDSDCYILYDYIRNLRIHTNNNRRNINNNKAPLSATYGYVKNGNNNGKMRPKSLLYKGWFVSRLKQDYPYLEDIFREFSNLYFKDLKWTNIMINKNFQTQPHRDANNIGESCIIGLGDYTGGELEVEGRGVINIQHNPTIFNGSELTHSTKAFKGERWSLVFFDNIFSC